MSSDDQEAVTVACPTCKKTVAWTHDNKWKPFCCERCKLIDLGDWADEKFRISSDTGPDFSNDSNP